MAHVAKYHHRSTSHKLEDQIDIYLLEDGHTGGTTNLDLAGHGTGWSRSTGEMAQDVDGVLFETVAQLIPLAATATFLSEIPDFAEGHFRLAMYRNSQLHFIGPVRPGLGARGRHKNHPYAIEATTGLHLLAEIPYPHFTVQIDRSKNLMWTLAEALKPLGLGLPFRVVAQAIIWGGLAGDPMAEAYPDQSAFGDLVTGQPVTCLDVVKACCQVLNCQLRQVKGKWQLDQVYDHKRVATPTAFLYDADGDFTDVETVNTTRLVCDGTETYKLVGRLNQKHKPATGTIRRTYQHDKAGQIVNGGMELEGVDNQPLAWASSSITRTRRTLGISVPFDERDSQEESRHHYELDAYYQEVPLPEDRFLPGGLWYVEAELGNWVAGLNNTIRIHFKARLALPPGLVVPRNPAARALLVQVEAGTWQWQEEGGTWTSADVWNRKYIPVGQWEDVSIDVDINTLPSTGKAKLKIAGIVDEYAQPKVPSAPPFDPLSWEYDITGVRIDRAFMEVVDDTEGAEPSSTVDIYQRADGQNLHEESDLVTRLGAPGPSTLHRTFLTNSSEVALEQWQIAGQPLVADRTLNDVAAEMTTRLMRNARFSTDMAFQAISEVVDLDRFMVIDTDGQDELYVAHRYTAEDLTDRWGGLYLAILDGGDTGLTRTEEKTNWASFAATSGGGLTVRQFSDRLVASLFTQNVLVTSETLQAQQYTTIQIQPAPAETFLAGWKVTLVDKDTLDIHVLTLVGDVQQNDASIEIEPYTFPKIIRVGAPCYPSDDPLTTLILTDAGLKLVVQGAPIGLVAETINSTVTQMDVSGWVYGLLTGATVLVEQDAGPDVRLTLTQDAPRGSTTIFFQSAALDVSVGNTIFPGDFVTQAQLQVLQDQIDLEVTRFNSTAVATSTQALSSGAATSLQVQGVGPLQLRKGDALQVTNMATGVSYRLILSADALLSEFSPTTLNFNLTALDVAVGDPLFSGTVTSLRVGLDGIDVRATYFKSDSFDGVLDDDGNLTTMGTTGWALNKAGAGYFAGGQASLLPTDGLTYPLHQEVADLPAVGYRVNWGADVSVFGIHRAGGTGPKEIGFEADSLFQVAPGTIDPKRKLLIEQGDHVLQWLHALLVTAGDMLDSGNPRAGLYSSGDDGQVIGYIQDLILTAARMLVIDAHGTTGTPGSTDQVGLVTETLVSTFLDVIRHDGTSWQRDLLGTLWDTGVVVGACRLVTITSDLPISIQEAKGSFTAVWNGSQEIILTFPTTWEGLDLADQMTFSSFHSPSETTGGNPIILTFDFDSGTPGTMAINAYEIRSNGANAISMENMEFILKFDAWAVEGQVRNL